ncbi:RNA-binding S4 domain protein [Bacillus methanolicus PB1]|uniref:RNA-binding S4 domain protein n=1 Tax=Bacillus methanolicus PB1 TaxID=997296 RepID=I3E503_BACMT|nr:RNA-binding protein [Bacillus methanolicus]EIJ81574.1 RNA-binding S4 domain protein [Bacillus methanolicus PB1]
MSIYQHFRPEERDFIERAIHWREFVETAFAPRLTDFLDPREQQILKAVVGQSEEIHCHLFGGTGGAERKRAVICPDYYQADREDFEICLFEINYPKKFITIEHRQVLGSLMSLGLKRGKFGDILIEGDNVQFFAAKEIADYVSLQLDSIGKASVTICEIPLENAIQIKESWIEETSTVSSLRLDAVISALYNLSRHKSQDLIKQGLVRVNWALIENNSFECGEGDVISIRGYGRSKILSIEGKTKKDKWRMVAGRQK